MFCLFMFRLVHTTVAPKMGSGRSGRPGLHALVLVKEVYKKELVNVMDLITEDPAVLGILP